MVCVEEFFIGHMGSAKGLTMLGTVVRMALYERGLPFFIIMPTQLKKYITGKGTGPKGIVIREVFKKWGVDAKDDNQADACVLSHIAEALLVTSDTLLKYQIEVIEKVKEERSSYNVA